MSSRVEELQGFLAESPDDPFLKYALTMEYRKMGDTAKTMAGFRDLTDRHPDYVGTYYHFAKFLEENGQKDEALDIYRKGMEMAERLRNRHAHGELLAAYRLAMGLEDEDDQ